MTKDSATYLWCGNQHDVHSGTAWFVRKIPNRNDPKATLQNAQKSLRFLQERFDACFLPKTRVIPDISGGYIICQKRVSWRILSAITPTELPLHTLDQLLQVVEKVRVIESEWVNFDLLGYPGEAMMEKKEELLAVHKKSIEFSRQFSFTLLRKVLVWISLFRLYRKQILMSRDIFKSSNLMIDTMWDVKLIDTVMDMEIPMKNPIVRFIEQWHKKYLLDIYRKQLLSLTHEHPQEHPQENQSKKPSLA